MAKKWSEPNLLFLDFEFSRITHEEVNLVSCVTHDSRSNRTRKFWLHNNEANKAELVRHLKDYKTIVGYACVAEARSFYSLGLNPLAWQWIDLFLEYRMLTNHNDKLNWGEQLVDGKVKKFQKPRPKWERTEEEAKNGFKPTHSLAEATFKLTGKIRDTVEKDECRKLIISDPKKFTKEERERILKYNALDVEFLPTIFRAMKREYEELAAEVDWEEYFDEAMWRGRYSAHTAIMESIGYPINHEATQNFARQIPMILAECQRDINEQFKDENGPFQTASKVAARIQGIPFKPVQPFKWHPKSATYSWNQKATREWLQKNGYADDWMRTDTDQLSLSLEAFERKFIYRHDYPRGNFGAQIVRFLKLKQSLYGFSTKGGNRKSFWDNVGPDKRVRPYMNIYGAQSGRSQPAATGFMFLKPAWMRALVEPAEGYYLAGIDYGQQEFFLAALLSSDQAMVEAYLSGDPYLYMAKEAGTIPPEGTKKTHPRERDLMKSTTLGILFNMTKYGLSAKLTADSGEEYTEDMAQELIETFESLFPDFTAWRKEVLWDYENGNAINILDGWKMWTDNDNPRSITNVPVQGAGSAVMRKAVDLAVEAGCRVVFTLHDAIYIEAKSSQEEHILRLHKAMRDAFSHFFEGTKFEDAAKKIKLDPKAWGPHFPEKGEITLGKIGLKVPVSRIHIDDRALSDYQRFSKYFSTPEADLL